MYENKLWVQALLFRHRTPQSRTIDDLFIVEKSFKTMLGNMLLFLVCKVVGFKVSTNVCKSKISIPCIEIGLQTYA